MSPTKATVTGRVERVLGIGVEVFVAVGGVKVGVLVDTSETVKGVGVTLGDRALEDKFALCLAAQPTEMARSSKSPKCKKEGDLFMGFMEVIVTEDNGRG
jgi:hypothetical protein